MFGGSGFRVEVGDVGRVGIQDLGFRVVCALGGLTPHINSEP